MTKDMILKLLNPRVCKVITQEDLLPDIWTTQFTNITTTLRSFMGFETLEEAKGNPPLQARYFQYTVPDKYNNHETQSTYIFIFQTPPNLSGLKCYTAFRTIQTQADTYFILHFTPIDITELDIRTVNNLLFEEENVIVFRPKGIDELVGLFILNQHSGYIEGQRQLIKFAASLL